MFKCGHDFLLAEKFIFLNNMLKSYKLIEIVECGFLDKK